VEIFDFLQWELDKAAQVIGSGVRNFTFSWAAIEPAESNPTQPYSVFQANYQ